MDSSASADYQRRFGGLSRLYGENGAAQIRDSNVAVIGIGGVGSWCAEALARSGVINITLIDLDNVAESNINRQVQAHTETIGQPKVEAMRERILLINPACRVRMVEDFVDETNVNEILSCEKLTAVIDACDQIRAKSAITDWCLRNNTKLISIGAAGGKQRADLLELDDLTNVTHDPLLAQLRYRLRKQYGFSKTPGKKLGVPCIFSREAVAKSDASCSTQQMDNSLNCAGYGSSVAVTASFGMAAAGWLLQEISKKNRI